MIMANCQLYDKYEVWRSIKGYEGRYCVSSRGRVKSVTRKGCNGQILKHKLTNDGRPIVTIRDKNNNKKTHRICVLVASAFLGERPTGMVCCHNDGDNKNNNVINLRWDTHKGNELDKKKHGTYLCGSKMYNATLTEDVVLLLKENLITKNMKRKEFCNLYGVSINSYKDIQRNKTWKHVKLEEGVSV